MENIVIKGKITATSKKLDNRYKQVNPTKTAYIETDGQNAQALEAFGLTKYTSVDDGKDFFIIKLSSNLVAYEDNTNRSTSLAELTTVDSPNFNTGQSEIYLNIIKGENMGNDFYRVQALFLPEGLGMLQAVEAVNPFI